MARRGRPGLSDEQKREVWERWKDGQSLSEIGRCLGRVPAVVYNVIRSNGGVVPATRTRSKRCLSLSEREEISRGLAAQESIRDIAERLNRNPSTISREIARNGGPEQYRAAAADQQAWDRAQRPKSCKLADLPDLAAIVADKLAEDWSPQQISGWLIEQYPHDHTMRVSHETIYLTLFIQARGVLKAELKKHLRTRRPTRRAKQANRHDGRGAIQDAVSIRERPAEVEDRAIPGHWEGDLISGSRNSHIATLVERSSRFTLLVKTPGKDAETVTAALAKHVSALPDELRKSLTWDRGSELAKHKDLALAGRISIYFCDPQSPWQRGSNENTNGLLRQYFPKDTDLSAHSQDHLDAIALKLNTRPRKTLGYKTPATILQATVATTD